MTAMSTDETIDAETPLPGLVLRDSYMRKLGYHPITGKRWQDKGILVIRHIGRRAFVDASSPRPSGSGRSDDGVVADGAGADGLLDDAGEAVAEVFGGAAVEAEHELVEIGREML